KEGEVFLTLSVNEQDMGKVIGRSGRIAKAIRSVMNAAASKQNKRISIDIQ
ncbi:KH domain-containing protein, partial [Oribacterium parvum]